MNQQQPTPPVELIITREPEFPGQVVWECGGTLGIAPDEATARADAAALAQPEPGGCPAPAPAGEVGELVAKLRVCASECPPLWAGLVRHAADLLEREGWCDDEGRCWCMSSLDGPPPRWWLVCPEPLSDGWVLPAHALPLPSGEEW